LASVAVWLPVMLLTPPESLARQDAFYRKVRPGGPGWAGARARTGLLPARPLGRDLLRLLAGTAVLFGVMFAPGAALLQRPRLALAHVALFLVGLAGLKVLANRDRRAGGPGTAAGA
jgi:hypothetical protein